MNLTNAEKVVGQQIKVPATYMRGGTSKGTFFRREDLPEFAQQPGNQRDAFLLRLLGSPDPYEKQIDGMGGATSSTTKAVIIDKSERQDADIDYYFGQVSIDKAFVDWSGNCGNLTAAVGAFAITQGFIAKEKIPEHGRVSVRIWQANIGKHIITHVPIANGQVQELGDFELDGVAFPAEEIAVEFLDPSDGEGDMFPTGKVLDQFEVPDVGTFTATFINAGIPTIFIHADELGFTATEMQGAINSDGQQLERLETIRAYGALKMGLITDLKEAETRQHTPKIAWVSEAKPYTSSSGKHVEVNDLDICVRAMSMGKLHHAMMGTAAVAIAAAASVPGTTVNLAAGGGERKHVRFGHPSGVLGVGAEARLHGSKWRVTKAVMSRSARVLMSGWVHVPYLG